MSDAQLLAVRPWTSSLTSLSVRFFISRMGACQTFPLVKCQVPAARYSSQKQFREAQK